MPMVLSNPTSATSSPTINGNGLVANVDGELYGVEARAQWPIAITDGDGRGDNPYFDFVGHWICALRAADLASTADQPIAVPASLYVLRRIVITLAAPTPAAAHGGLYTMPAKGGDKLLDIPLASLTPLTTKLKAATFALTESEARSTPYFYLTLDAAEAAPCKASIFVYGDVIVGGDERGAPY